MMNNLTIEIGQDFSFNIRLYILIRKISYVRSYCLISHIFFSKTIKWCKFSCRSTIECTLNRNNTTQSIVFHVIRKNHKLRNINKSSKFLVGKSLTIHSRAFFYHTAPIIWFFNLYKYQWQTIDKNCNIWSKFILIPFTSKLCCTMIHIILRLIKIHQLNRRYSSQSFIKPSSKVIIIQFLSNHS